VIYKSASSVRSIVAPLGDGDLPRLASLRGLATQLLAEIQGSASGEKYILQSIFCAVPPKKRSSRE